MTNMKRYRKPCQIWERYESRNKNCIEIKNL